MEPSRALVEASRLRLVDRDEEAAATLTSALVADPTHPDLLRELASTQLALSRLDEARRHAEQAILGDPQRPGAHQVLAFVLLAQGDTRAASEASLRGLACDPVNVTSLLNHARLCRLIAKRVGRARGRSWLASASSTIATAVREDPMRVPVRLEAALIAEATSDRSSADEHARAVLALEPDHAGAHLLLGRLAARSRDVERSSQHLATAGRLAPISAKPVDELRGLRFPRWTFSALFVGVPVGGVVANQWSKHLGLDEETRVELLLALILAITLLAVLIVIAGTRRRTDRMSSDAIRSLSVHRTVTTVERRAALRTNVLFPVLALVAYLASGAVLARVTDSPEQEKAWGNWFFGAVVIAIACWGVARVLRRRTRSVRGK